MVLIGRHLSRTVCLLALFAAGCADIANHSSFTNQVASPSEPVTEIVVATFNIRLGLGPKDQSLNLYANRLSWRNLPQVTETLQSLQADLVALQEVSGSGQAERLAEALNMNFAYAGHPASRGLSWWGVAVLSKFTILETQTLNLGGAYGRDRRALFVTVDIDGRKTVFVCVHRDKDDSSARGFKLLNERVRSIAVPVILAGDFNVRYLDDRLDSLQDFADTALSIDTSGALYAHHRGTWYYGNARIDYVFVNTEDFRVIDAGLPAPPYWHASDHLAYFARLVPR